MRPVRTDRRREGPIEAIDAANAIFLHFDEGQLSCRRVPAEHGHRIVHIANDVDVCSIGADRRRIGPVEAIDAAQAILVYFDKGQEGRAGRGGEQQR